MNVKHMSEGISTGWLQPATDNTHKNIITRAMNNKHTRILFLSETVTIITGTHVQRNKIHINRTAFSALTTGRVNGKNTNQLRSLQLDVPSYTWNV